MNIYELGHMLLYAGSSYGGSGGSGSGSYGISNYDAIATGKLYIFGIYS